MTETRTLRTHLAIATQRLGDAYVKGCDLEVRNLILTAVEEMRAALDMLDAADTVLVDATQSEHGTDVVFRLVRDTSEAP